MYSEKYQSILHRLKSCRILSGFKSARAFSAAYSVPQRTYALHESGDRKIPIDALLEYSACLKIDSSWLMTGEGVPSTSANLNKKINEHLLQTYNLQITLSKLYSDKFTKIVDCKLLTLILTKLFDVVSKNNIQTGSNDIVDFAYSIYNSVVNSSIDEQTRINLVDLAVNSMLAANQSINTDNKFTSL